MQLETNDRTQTRERIRTLLETSPGADVYFRAEYLWASEKMGGGTGTSLVLGVGPMRALCNLLVRRNEKVCDAFTPYGYGGLLWLSRAFHSEDASRYLFESLRRWCRDEGLVSCLLRLHPLLENQFCLDHLENEYCRVHERGPSLALRLSDWNEQRDRAAGMNKGRISDLSLARRHLHAEIWQGAKEISPRMAIFKEMYEATMTRLRASPFYHFPDSYYASLIEGLDTRLMLVLARKEKEYVGASLFFVDKRFAHYHLSASTDEGLRMRATTLMIHEAAATVRQQNCEWLHLGGGIEPNDNLHRFKASFGAQVFPYRYVTVIADLEKYDALMKAEDPIWPYRAAAMRHGKV